MSLDIGAQRVPVTPLAIGDPEIPCPMAVHLLPTLLGIVAPLYGIAWLLKACI